MARVTLTAQLAASRVEAAQLRALAANYAHSLTCAQREIKRLKSLVPAQVPNTRPTVSARNDAIRRYFAAHPDKRSVSPAELQAFAQA